MIIRIKDLRLRAIIGFNEWEREKKQDISINLTIESAAERAVETDDIADGIDYKVITKGIIASVETSEFFLLERLAGFILDQVMTDDRIDRATVEIDKPHALRFARSTSVELTRER
ncbi:MAG: dihydroneopterin aldolase [Proteobacteria bacterium]|nr:dihydroneopterin aldolase [Pseudomonadota bacterium]